MNDYDDAKGCGMVIALVLLSLVVLIGSCVYSGVRHHGESQEETVRDIHRIMMHEPHSYSFLLDDGQFHRYTIQRGSRSADILYDAPSDGYCWAEVHYSHYFGDGMMCDRIKLHIHSPQEINGGGWNHGKLGKGQTVVVE